jgi:hypothetical protein
MNEEPAFDPDAVIDAMAPLLGLTVTDVYRPGVVTNLEICARFAAILAEAPPGDHDEPAPVFSA